MFDSPEKQQQKITQQSIREYLKQHNQPYYTNAMTFLLDEKMHDKSADATQYG